MDAGTYQFWQKLRFFKGKMWICKIWLNLRTLSINCRENFKKPILIFDVCSIIGYLCANQVDILFGGTNDAYYEDLSKIFSRLSENAELFFFMDGFIPEHKYLTWQKRQNSKYSDSIKVIKKIQEGVSLNEIARTTNTPYVNTMLNVIEAVAIKYGTLKYAVRYECDQEIAQFASQHWRVLAVFSEATFRATSAAAHSLANP